MTYDHVDRFVLIASAGGGLLLAGGLNLLVKSAGPGVRTVSALVPVLVAGGIIGAWTGSAAVGLAFAVVLAAALLVGACCNRFLVRGLACVAHHAGRPIVRAAGVAALGLFIVVAAGAVLVVEDEARISADAHDIAMLSSTNPPRRTEPIVALTDRGTRIELSTPTVFRQNDELRDVELAALDRAGFRDSVIRRRPAHESANCFGWVFAHDRFWLSDAVIDPILTDNGYQATTDPKPGDLVIYRGLNGLPSHAAVVRYVTEGMPVLVEGKWGWMGVFVHPTEKSPYGSNFTYYRSPRTSHQLAIAGIESDPPGVPLTGAE